MNYDELRKEVAKQLKPGWIPEGWTKGESINVDVKANHFEFSRDNFFKYELNEPLKDTCIYHFPIARYSEFKEWSKWWFSK